MRSDSSGCFPANRIADFRTKLATPLELEYDRWEVVLVEISYPKGYKKRFWHITLLFGMDETIFTLKYLDSVFDLLTNIPQSFEPSVNENFTPIFSNCINKNKGITKICLIHVAGNILS